MSDSYQLKEKLQIDIFNDLLLLRCMILELSSDKDKENNDNFKNAIIFTSHHSIIEGKSLHAKLLEFFEIIESIYETRYLKTDFKYEVTPRAEELIQKNYPNS